MGLKIVSGPTKAMLHCSFECSHSKDHTNVDFKFIDENGKTKKIKLNIVHLSYFSEDDEYMYECVGYEARKTRNASFRKCRIIYNSKPNAEQKGRLDFIG